MGIFLCILLGLRHLTLSTHNRLLPALLPTSLAKGILYLMTDVCLSLGWFDSVLTLICCVNKSPTFKNVFAPDVGVVNLTCLGWTWWQPARICSNSFWTASLDWYTPLNMSCRLAPPLLVASVSSKKKATHLTYLLCVAFKALGIWYQFGWILGKAITHCFFYRL